MEYNAILDRAGTEPDPARRMALVAIHGITQLTICERTNTKPFNPLLGETYEYVCDDFSFLSEQVSHHPPITANYCRSSKGLYSIHSNQKTNTHFNGRYLTLSQQYRTYIDLDKFGERYELQMPVLSAHNLVFGHPYADIGGEMIIRKVERPDGSKAPDNGEECVLNFTRSSVFQAQTFEVKGEVTQGHFGKQKRVIKIFGHWNDKVYMQEVKGDQEVGEPELVFQKHPYPELWAQMYGMSHFSL